MLAEGASILADSVQMVGEERDSMEYEIRGKIRLRVFTDVNCRLGFRRMLRMGRLRLQEKDCQKAIGRHFSVLSSLEEFRLLTAADVGGYSKTCKPPIETIPQQPLSCNNPHPFLWHSGPRYFNQSNRSDHYWTNTNLKLLKYSVKL